VKLILSESVPNLGEAGDVVSVKPGFARNYLIPQGMAIPATQARVQQVEHHRRVVAEKVAKERKELEALRARVEAIALQVRARVGAEGKLFGSVTAAQIGDLLAAAGVEVDRRRIELSEPIKEAGEHSVAVRLQRDLVAQVKITVLPEE
jgi:large subunit ribosomal protein L9